DNPCTLRSRVEIDWLRLVLNRTSAYCAPAPFAASRASIASSFVNGSAALLRLCADAEPSGRAGTRETMPAAAAAADVFFRKSRRVLLTHHLEKGRHSYSRNNRLQYAIRAIHKARDTHCPNTRIPCSRRA